MERKEACSIREFAQFIGLLVASCPGVEYGMIHSKSLEVAKLRALEENNDTSKTGWGAFCNGKKAYGHWTSKQSELHINQLELKAALLALKSFANDLTNRKILLRIDNTTAMAYINKMGGVKVEYLHTDAEEFWNWCEERRLWVFAEYISSRENKEADTLSRIQNKDIEWELADYAFREIQNTTPSFSIQTYPGCRQIISEAFRRRGTSEDAADIMLKAWEDSTIKQYNNALKLWWNWNSTQNTDPFDVSISKVLEFLTLRYQNGANYGTLNSSRSALATISTEDIGTNDLVKKFIKGSSKTRPNKPRYDSTWDVDPVLKGLQKWFPLELLTLKQLSQKLVLLLALGTAHRLQTLALIKISNISSSDKGLEVKIPDRIKSSRVGTKQPLLKLPFFKEKPGLCIAKTLLHYLKVTQGLRNGEDTLFISFQRPHKKVKKDTLGKWLKSSLILFGVDRKFTPHSTRHASTSKAFEKGVSIEEIKRIAGWSPNSKVFADFYNRPIISTQETFARTVLSPNN
ncbi:uncharacterized protein [Linepithema humile]|uniref:uncharacterized protein n=1 Tax=Linepithema humile TaxID=83485 RepID=UPI00351F0097